MKTLITKSTGYIGLLGLLIFGVVLWDNIQKWNVSMTPEMMDIGVISNKLSINRYVTIEGGRLDIENAFEENLTTKKSASKISSNFYIPVITSEDKAVYIVKRTQPPTLSDLISQVSTSGLLLAQSELSRDMLDAFTEIYSFKTKIFVLDQTFQPKSRLERAKNLLYPLFAIVSMLLLRFLLTRDSTDAPVNNSDRA